jgi:3-hydroxyisobutyrate dehydrogenase-like beta-hydroxyacid dehydrogenase
MRSIGSRSFDFLDFLAPSRSNRGPQVIARDWSPGFTIDLRQKDLRLVLDAFERLQIPRWARV